jgi:hypothetical protein
MGVDIAEFRVYPMNRENRLLVSNEPVEFEKHLDNKL